MNTLETVPALSEAEQLAEVVKSQPEKLREKIAASTLDELDALARVIDEKKIAVRVDSIAAIQERVDVLEKAQAIDQHLAELNSRLHLVRLLNIKAPAEPATSKLDFVASFLRGTAERTKGIPVLSFVTGLFKNTKGRSIERAWNTVLATLEKNPTVATTAGTAFLGPIGLLVGTLGLNFGARKRLLELDMLDAIDREKFIGEKITAAGIAPSDMDKFKDKLATANIPQLTSAFVRDQRKLVPAGTPITVTLEAILSPEKTQTQLAEQQVEIKKNAVAEKLKPLDIALVSFGTPVAAKKNGAGRYEITLPDKDDAISSPEVRKLQEAMTVLTNAREITIGLEKERLTLDVSAKSALIPVNALLTDSVNRGFSHSNARLERIIFATPAELPIKTMQAKFDSGTLLLGANAYRTQALEQISGLDTLLESAQNGALFVFNNGTWTTPATPIPASPSTI
ncbi:MAG: hypothetical protein KBA40_02380 [Candidatus Peribacteraceae bacterium]|nr:hypothetical protein [Candidatus Peribacteraceae bacterium]MBP9850181.1 hypothetical protein [Candidatus Peribacteraceae bacterium]